MKLKEYIPFFNEISDYEKELLENSCIEKIYTKGEKISDGTECSGLFAIVKGRLRVYTNTEDGKEITLYRLYEYDVCLLSSSCIMNSIDFDIMIESEEDTKLIWIPTELYKKLMDTNLKVASFTNEIMADRFSEVMWVLNQILNNKMDKRIAGFLLEEAKYKNDMTLKLTHEQIARNLGTAREVVGRLMSYFQKEGVLKVNRGEITVIDMNKLVEIAEN